MKEIRVKLNEADHADLKKLAQKKKTTISALARNYIVQEINKGLLESSMDDVLNKIRRVVRQEIKPVSDRLGNVLYKSAIDNKTALILNYLALKEFTHHDIEELKNKARLKAIADLKLPVEEIMKDETNE